MTAVRTIQEPAADLRSRRVKAGWIDIALLFVIVILMLVIFGRSSTTHVSGTINGKAFHSTDHSRNLSGAWTYAWCGLCLLYYFLTELLTGQTLGKRLMGVHVTTVSGDRPSATAIFIRTLGRIVDVLPFFYLLGWLVVRGRHQPPQRIGDRLAGTTVALTTERP